MYPPIYNALVHEALDTNDGTLYMFLSEPEMSEMLLF